MSPRAPAENVNLDTQDGETTLSCGLPGYQPDTIDVPSGVDAIHVRSNAGTIAATANVTLPLWILGGPGDHAITGGAGDDYLDGGPGANTIHGGAGNDTLLGGAGSDTLFGDAGDDTLLPGSGPSVLHGGNGFNSPEIVDDGETHLFDSTLASYYSETGTWAADGRSGASFNDTQRVHAAVPELPDCPDGRCR